ncbi:hypothetical protein AX16_004634 [Volvariella volvacea WC 439]|nr:hypothetical protein AX16_004634 [Volvariella volvacea WC 439]
MSSVNFTSSTPTSQRLPSEMFGQIVQLAWLLPLSTADRIHMMTTFPLVNRSFYLCFREASIRDIIIPHPKYIAQVFSILTSDYRVNAVTPKQAHNQIFSANKTCRSITFRYDLAYILRTMKLRSCDWCSICLGGKISNGQEAMLDAALEFSSLINYSHLLPNFESLGIQLVDIDAHRSLQFISAIRIPSKIRSLHIEIFRRDPELLNMALTARCDTCEKVDSARSWKKWKFNIENVKELSVDGSAGDVVGIGAGMIPYKAMGAKSSLENLHLVVHGEETEQHKKMINALHARAQWRMALLRHQVSHQCLT